jgi:hypothetical protein
LASIASGRDNWHTVSNPTPRYTGSSVLLACEVPIRRPCSRPASNAAPVSAVRDSRLFVVDVDGDGAEAVREQGPSRTVRRGTRDRWNTGTKVAGHLIGGFFVPCASISAVGSLVLPREPSEDMEDI